LSSTTAKRLTLGGAFRGYDFPVRTYRTD
jgi:hypothetical protein